MGKARGRGETLCGGDDACGVRGTLPFDITNQHEKATTCLHRIILSMPQHCGRLLGRLFHPWPLAVASVFLMLGTAFAQVPNERCVECHSRIEIALLPIRFSDGEEVSPRIDAATFSRSVHAELACIECHRGSHPEFAGVFGPRTFPRAGSTCVKLNGRAGTATSPSLRLATVTQSAMPRTKAAMLLSVWIAIRLTRREVSRQHSPRPG